MLQVTGHTAASPLFCPLPHLSWPWEQACAFLYTFILELSKNWPFNSAKTNRWSNDWRQRKGTHMEEHYCTSDNGLWVYRISSCSWPQSLWQGATTVHPPCPIMEGLDISFKLIQGERLGLASPCTYMKAGLFHWYEFHLAGWEVLSYFLW